MADTTYTKTGSLVLFKNTNKKEDKHPDYQGTLTLESGDEHRISGWTRKDKNGNAFISAQCSVSSSDNAPAENADAPAEEAPAEEADQMELF